METAAAQRPAPWASQGGGDRLPALWRDPQPVRLPTPRRRAVPHGRSVRPSSRLFNVVDGVKSMRVAPRSSSRTRRPRVRSAGHLSGRHQLFPVTSGEDRRPRSVRRLGRDCDGRKSAWPNRTVSSATRRLERDSPADHECLTACCALAGRRSRGIRQRGGDPIPGCIMDRASRAPHASYPPHVAASFPTSTHSATTAPDRGYPPAHATHTDLTIAALLCARAGVAHCAWTVDADGACVRK